MTSKKKDHSLSRRTFIAGAGATGLTATAVGQEQTEDNAARLSEPELRTKALESLLIEKGLVASDAIEEIIRIYEEDVGPKNGACVVARAWARPEYKRRLLEDGTEAIAELGYSGAQGAHIVVKENTPTIHNLIVCTLCSCYPWPVLGLPPAWYKSAAYRARAVREPRKVLAEFGVDLGESVEVRVWDSTAEVRYMVLPERPLRTEFLTEEELATLVTRDSMVGTGKIATP